MSKYCGTHRLSTKYQQHTYNCLDTSLFVKPTDEAPRICAAGTPQDWSEKKDTAKNMGH